MYTKETLKKIADVLKLDVSVFEANLKSDKEETLEVPTLFTEDEKKSFGENRFTEGKKAASEILVKDLKVKHGLEFDGKSVDMLLEKFSEKVIADANIKPDEKVKKLDTENKELKSKLQLALDKEQSLTKDYEGKLFHVGITTEVLKNIPKETIIPPEDLVELFMNRYRVVKEDNGVITYKGSDKIVDKVLNPVPLKDVVTQFSEPYIKRNGMGGGDTSGGGTVGKFTTMSSFVDYCQKNGIDLMSEKGLKLLSENKKAVSNFDENS